MGDEACHLGIPVSNRSFGTPGASGNRPRISLSVAGYGVLLFGVFSAGSAFELLVTKGMCWVYLMAYFIAFVAILGVRRVGRFGTGVAVFLPYAIPGFFIEYWMEYVDTPSLIAPWAAAVWAGNGLLAGLVADLSHKLLPRSLGDALRAVISGLATVLTYWFMTLLTLAFLYVNPAPGVAHFLNGLAFTLPWLLVSAGFGGYTAYAMSRSPRPALGPIPPDTAPAR